MKGNFFYYSLIIAVILLAFFVRPAQAHPLSSNYAAGICGSQYTVRSGDTLSAIAGRCGVTLSSLLSANGLRATSIIYPGQRLAIPGGAASGVTSGVSSNAAPTYVSCTSPYTVRAGDTLSLIAARCGVSIANLKSWNGLTNNWIRVGQKLYLPSSTPSIPAAPPASSSYVTPQSYARPQPTPTPQIETPISRW